MLGDCIWNSVVRLFYLQEAEHALTFIAVDWRGMDWNVFCHTAGLLELQELENVWYFYSLPGICSVSDGTMEKIDWTMPTIFITATGLLRAAITLSL